jgi:RND family efflux transporter MFP subunit
MKSWISAVLFFALSVAFCGCSKSGETGETTASKEAKEEKGKSGKDERQERADRVRPAVPVKVSEVDQGMITSSLVFDSVLETESSVEIFAETSGLILEVHVEEGDRVVAGQILALMENVEEGVDAEEAKARYEHQKANFKRTEDLYGRKLINQQEYDNAKFDLEQMRLRFERAKIQLENTIVRSTVSGVVTERNAQAGRRVATNRVLFSIMNLDELFANVNIPGQHMLSIEQGLPAVIDSDLIEGVRYDAFVKLVSPIVDPESGTFKAKVAVSKLNGMPIYPGMFVNVRVIVDTSDDAVLIPKEAIVHEGDLKYIFKVQNGKAKKTLLQEGYSNVGFVQATSDIVKGDLVIVMGHSALKDGANVKIVEEAVAAEQGTTNSSDAGQG